MCTLLRDGMRCHFPEKKDHNLVKELTPVANFFSITTNSFTNIVWKGEF